MKQKEELTSLYTVSQFAYPKVRRTERGNELRKMKNIQKGFLILSVEQETVKVKEHAGTKQTEGQKLLFLLVSYPGSQLSLSYVGEVTMKEKESREGKKTEK